MGTILLIGGIGLLAVLGIEFGLYRRAKNRQQEGMFDHGPPYIADGHHADGDRIGDQGAIDHVDPSDHPGV